VFFNVTNAFVTSPMPCVTSMLVLQPNTSTEIDGPPGIFVSVGDGVSEITTNGVLVGNGANVMVAVEMLGVAVKIDGVGVKGRNGVGGLPGNG